MEIHFAIRRGLIASFVIVHAASLAAQGNDIDRTLLEDIAAKQRASVHQFDNMHAIWTNQQTEFNGRETKERIEFWSREGKYYRVDGAIYDAAGEYVVKVYRTIVSPEGYVRLLAESDTDPGVITKVGSSEEGTALIKSSSWFHAGNKIGYKGMYIHEISSAILKGDDKQLNGWKYQFSKSPNGNVLVKYSVENEERNVKGSVVLDGNEFRKLSFEGDDWMVSGRHFFGKASMQYDKNYALPTRRTSETSFTQSSESDILKASSLETLQEIQLGPAPLEVFYPEWGPSRPSGSAWGRRIAVLLVGIVFLALYFRYRRRFAEGSGGQSNP